jgi:succinoglycan biosynthesis transport protein ExoP
LTGDRPEGFVVVEEGSINWLQHFETIWRRRKAVLTIGLAGSLAVAGWIWFTPPLYRAHATILLGAQRVSTPRSDAMPDKAIDSEMALLASPALVKDVLQELGVVPAQATSAATAATAGRAKPPVDAPSNPVSAIYRRAHGLPPPDPYDQQVRAVAKGIETSRIEESNVIDVGYRGKDPRWAAKFVNTLLAKHVERIARLNEQPDTRQFYQSQRELVFRRLQVAREALNRFREKQGSDLAPADDGELHKSLTMLDGEHATAQSQLAEAQARVAYLRQEIGRHPPKIASETEMRQSEGVRLLEGRLAQLEMQRSEAITKYTPTSTPVRELDAQIAETRKMMAGREMEHLGSKTAVNPTHQALELELVQRQAEAAALAARVRALGGEQGRLHGQISHLATVTPELERLQNDEKSANDSYLDYMKKGEEARLTTALDQSGLVNISILERAEVPDSPEPAKAAYKLLVGCAASFLLGALLALVLERLDPVVNSGAQAERMTGVPVIETVTIPS